MCDKTHKRTVNVHVQIFQYVYDNIHTPNVRLIIYLKYLGIIIIIINFLCLFSNKGRDECYVLFF